MTVDIRFVRLVAIVALVAGLCGGWPGASVQARPPVAAPPEMTPPADWTPLTIEQLDEMLAPIALYPDALLAQVLAASTYPVEIVMAARWVRANPDMVNIDRQGWDPSVAAVARFPDVISMMDQYLDWTTQLGEAFLFQRTDVMDRIQALRDQAWDAGALLDTPEQIVIVDREYIRIVPAHPDFIYVPCYDPAVVFVRPVWGHFRRPVIWFSIGFSFGPWLHLDCDWRHHHIVHHHHHHIGHKHGHHGPDHFGEPWHHDARHGHGEWQRAAQRRTEWRTLPAPPEPWKTAPGSGAAPPGPGKPNPAEHNSRRTGNGSRSIAPPPSNTPPAPPVPDRSRPSGRNTDRSAPRDVVKPPPMQAPPAVQPPSRPSNAAPRSPSTPHVTPAPRQPSNVAPRQPSNVAPRQSPPQRATPAPPPGRQPSNVAPPPAPAPRVVPPAAPPQRSNGNNAPGNGSGNRGK